MKAAMVLCALVGSTSAAPIGEAWRLNATCDSSEYTGGFAIGDTTFASISKGRLSRRGLAKGDELGGWKLPHDQLVFIEYLDDSLIVVRDPHGFNVYDSAGKLSFHRIIKKNGTEHRFALGVGSGKIAYDKPAKKAGTFELDDLEGNKLWEVPVANKNGVATLSVSPNTVFESELTKNTTAFHSYSGGDGTPLATWTPEEGDTADSILTDSDQLAVAGKQNVYVLDANLKVVWKQPLRDGRLGRLVAGRLYATDIDGNVFAFDRKSGKIVWKKERSDASWTKLVAVTAAAVYAIDQDKLEELELATGKVVASIGVANMRVDAGRSMMLACNGTQVIAYDPHAKDIAVEKATVTGKVKHDCHSCGQTWVAIAGTVAPVNKDGTFKLAINGRGSYRVNVQFVEQPSGQSSDQTIAKQTLELTGKGTYDLGLISVEQGFDGD